MNKEATFSSNINQKVSNAKKMVGWILRTFHSRGQLAMMTLFKSLVIPRVEYCCQLWNPDKQGDIRDIEGVQKSFTRKITGLSEMKYWERLDALNLYSLERRRERYIIIYVWKIIQGMVPNVEGANRIRTATGRNGLHCEIPPLGRGTSSSTCGRSSKALSQTWKGQTESERQLDGTAAAVRSLLLAEEQCGAFKPRTTTVSS